MSTIMSEQEFSAIIADLVSRPFTDRLDDCDYRSFDYAMVRAHFHEGLKTMPKAKAIPFVMKAVKFGMTLSKLAALNSGNGNEAKGVKWDKYGIPEEEKAALRKCMVTLRQGGFTLLDLPKAFPELALKIFLSGNYEPIVKTTFQYAFPGGYFFCETTAEKRAYAEYNRDVTELLSRKMTDPEARRKALSPETWETVSQVMDKQKSQHPSLKTSTLREKFATDLLKSGSIGVQNGQIVAVGTNVIDPAKSLREQLSAAVWKQN